jgi:hypothetical protein
VSKTTTTTVLTTRLDIVGPFDLREIATMGFGHRDERSFDGRDADGILPGRGLRMPSRG